ncbi:glucosamine--fructose-6-phosphate aminotransferase [isomerizing] [Ruminococcus sp. CAG:55]|nr:glucosamine--fructose-6-phosphate aminotransferase [isomerizing] [Ruminococcus sp. CAG:55]
MCGIVGFTGNHQAAPILLDGLSKLEYRGYDSAGLAVRDGEHLAQVVKAKGRLSNLSEKTDSGKALKGNCGIGHTRWATHGEPSQINAHPHVSGNCERSGSGTVESEVVGVHNGIIENYTELKEKLLKHGYTFYSDTDTEVVIKLVDYYYKKYNLGPIDAIAKTMVRVRGSYALELMFKDYPGEIWVARKDSPMIIGIADGETYVASDVPAILKYTRNVYYIGNLEFAKLVPGEAHFYDLNGDEIEKETTEIKWDAEAAEKAGFEHFMMKEIYEQPKAIRDTLNSVAKDGVIDFTDIDITEEEIKKYSQIYIVACGSAWHVGVEAQYVIEEMAQIPVRVELASEFRYREMPLVKDGLVIVISQSGETADTLAAMRMAKDKGLATLAVVNVIGSSIAREADKVFYTLAGPEISVATTKGYSAQLVALDCIAVQFAKVKGLITDEQYSYYISELQTIPEKIEKILQDKERIQWFAAKYANAHDVFFVGRGVDYAVCLEGSLKLKEISYIHSEAYAAGELKHGTISLIEDNILVIGVLTQSKLYEKTVSNIREMPLVKNGLVIVISQSGETADTLAAMRMAKEKGLATLAVVNVIGSSIAREADKVFYTLAGPEISVATTKGYSAQLAALDCIAVQFAKVKELITDEQYSYYISELQTIPEKIEKILQDKERIQWFAAKYANAHDVFFVGRGVDYAVCLEGSLKLKEISYIHSEAYAAGELKHGTISLIEDNILVIGVLTQSKLYEKTVSNMMECKSRGAYLMGVTNYGNYEMEDKVDFTVYVPKVDEHFMGNLAVIPLQLLGYYVSVAKGLDVDKPRNLAKSVTVE